MEINAILSYLYQRTGYDFRGYRETTLARRIKRRFHVTKSQDYQGYLKFLETSPNEFQFLLKDLTIRVTEFFREPESWDVVAKMVIPKLLEARDEGRIWSAGCATGEEAYSLAIIWNEAGSWKLENRVSSIQLPASSFQPPASSIQLPASSFQPPASSFQPPVSSFQLPSILATDLDEDSLAQADKGIYATEKIKLVPPPIREKYFHFTPNGYQVLPQVKKQVTFRRHDLVGEAISESFDLIVCRNVLIYFSKELQEKVLLKFYEALNPGGFLWLGKAESLWGKPQKFFECVDKGAKVFRKLEKDR